MSTLTATPDSQRSIIRLDLDLTDTLILPDAYAIVRTRLDTGAVQQIRQSTTTLPITAVYQQINANADFELGTNGWLGIAQSGPAPAISTDNGAGHFHRGSNGLKIVTSATSNTGPAAESEKCAVIPGQIYAVSAWVTSSTAPYLPSVGINWYDASGTLIGTTLGPSSVASPGAEAVVQPTFNQPDSTNGYGWIAPAQAATATVVVGFNAEGSFGGSSLTFYVDECRLLQLVSLGQGLTTPPVPTSNTDATVPVTVNLLTSGKAVAWDHEMPLDTQVSYTATGYVVNGTWACMVGGQNIEVNSDFESTTSPWTALSGTTLATSTTQAHSGARSLRLTSDGVTANTGAAGEFQPAATGATYGFTGWVFMTTGAAFQVGVVFYDPAGGFINQAILILTPTTGTWTLFNGIGQLPAAASQVGLVAKFQGVGAAANLVYIDQMNLWSPTTVPPTATSGPVTCPGGGVIWLKDPLAPGNSLQVTGPRKIYGGWGYFSSPRGIGFLGVPDEIRKAFSAAADVNNQDTPMYQTRRRGARSSSLHLLPHSFDDREALRTLVSAGTPLLFQAPSQYGIPDGYLLLGDETTGLLGQDMRREARAYQLPFQVVAAPSGPAQAPQSYRWQDTGRLYASWGAAMASGGGVYDPYDRNISAGGLGVPKVAPVAAYTLVGTAANFDVSQPLGARTVLAAAATPALAVLGSYGDLKALQVTFTAPAVATGAAYQVGLAFRYQDASNYYRVILELAPAGTATIRWIRRVGGVETTVSTGGVGGYVAGQTMRMEVRLTSVSATAYWWIPANEARNAAPDLPTVTDGSPGVLANPGAIGWYAQRLTSNTNANLTPIFDDLLLDTGPTWQQAADGALA